MAWSKVVDIPFGSTGVLPATRSRLTEAAIPIISSLPCPSASIACVILGSVDDFEGVMKSDLALSQRNTFTKTWLTILSLLISRILRR
mmetsp:Transcript_38270/g.56499  ORF Transcript_38270/g.56499 Transcript_38270/m.56499 type:complete len:88 (+) Transcript_38270:782-1045(+)